MKRLLLLVATLTLVPAASAQTKVETVHIRVLNGHSGKPVKRADTSTLVFPLSPYTTPIERQADTQGNLSLLVPIEGQLTLTVIKHPSCRRLSKADRAKGPAKVSLQDIFATGFVEANGCNQRSIAPSPGELIVYVRPLHWWESLRD